MANINRRHLLGVAGAAGSALAATGLIASPARAVTARASSTTASPVSVRSFGAVGDGIADDTQAIRRAIEAMPDAGGTVFFPAGTYRVTATITLRSRLTLIGDHATLRLDIPAPTSTFALLLAEGCEDIRLERLHFAFITSRMWSLQVRRCARITIADCSTAGGHLFTASGPVPQNLPSPQVTADDINHDIVIERCRLVGLSDYSNPDGAITVRYTDRFRLSDNTISGYSHGIQWWGGDAAIEKDGAVGNERKASHGVIVGNTVTAVRKGGIWGSMGRQITVTGNVVDTVGDVGIDFEGCFQCTATGNTVVDARYAALAIFFNNRDIVFAGNTVLATVPLTDWMFWVANGGNSPDNRSVSLVGNAFLDQSGKIGRVGGSYVESIQFADNNLRNVRIEFTMRGFQHSVTDNQLLFDVAAGTAFDACHVGGDRNNGVTKVLGNTVRSLVAQPADSCAIRVSQADPDRDTRSLVTSNVTGGFPVDLHAYTNAPNAERRHRFAIKDNDLGSASYRRTDAGVGRSLVTLDDNVSGGATPFPALVPTSGSWDRGQQVRFAEPTSGGHIGAVCVTAGAPGTWKSFGAISS